MTRTIGLVVVFFGALGLAAGWLASGPFLKLGDGKADRAVGPAAAVRAEPPASGDLVRHEFLLGQQDVANDRETPAVAADDEGRVLLAWAAQSGESERTLYLARSTDGGKSFAAPVPWRKVPISKYSSPAKGQREAMTYSTHVLPRLVSSRGEFVLGWVEAIGGGPAVAYLHGPLDRRRPQLRCRNRASTARTRRGPALPHCRPRRRAHCWPHGSTAATAASSPISPPSRRIPQGSSPSAWCMTAPKERASAPAATWRPSGCPTARTWSPSATATVGTATSISPSARPGGPFGKPAPLSRDNWKFEGCPHDGPSLALSGNRLSAAWMSAFSGRNRVYVASSTASAPVVYRAELHPGALGAQAHPKLAVSGSGKLYAVWDESLDDSGPATTSSQHARGHEHGAR